MRNDQIFVLLLVILLPMSGCFDGGGIGTAEADSESENNDTTEVFTSYSSISPQNMRVGDGGNYGTIIWEYLFSINTTSNEGLEIISVSSAVNGYYHENYDNSNRTRTTFGQLYVISNCESGHVWNNTALTSTSSNLNRFLPTVGDICQHDIFVSATHTGDDPNTTITDVQTSLTWKIHEVTLV